MGANLYLSSVLDECFSRYGQAFHLVQALNRVLEGDLSHELVGEGQALKAALCAHAEQARTMSPALFDLVAEIGDLTQGEGAVWEQALADQIATVLAQSNPLVKEASGGTPWLADDLAEILKGRTDAALAHGLPWLVQRVERLVPQAPEAERTLTQTLAELCRSLLDVQQGQPARALALVVEKHVLPQLEQACADQARCLHGLAQVLQPLQSALAASGGEATEGVAFAPAQALSRWQQIAQRLHHVLAVLQEALQACVRQAPFPVHEAGSQISQAWEQAQEIWREGGVCQEELTEAMRALGTLLVRTLPPLAETVAEETPATTADHPSSVFPSFPTTSPLQQAFGIVCKHHLFCHAAIHLLEHAAAIVTTVRTGDQRQALLALCDVMIALLGAAQSSSFHTEEKEELTLPFTHQATVPLAASVPLTAGVTLVPGTVMDTHLLGVRAAARAMQQDHRAQEWVKHVLGDVQATHPGGLILSFWRLVQGEPILWALLLTRILEEQLPGDMAADAATTLCARLTQLQHLLYGDPLPRLQAVLSELEAAIPAASPLGPPTARLQRLAQQQHTFVLQELLQALSQEIQDQTERGAWPADRIQDVRWLLALSQEILQAPVADQASLLLTTLAQIVQSEAPTEDSTEEEVPDQQQEELLAQLAAIENDQDRLQVVATILAALPDPDLHAPRSDPRHDAGWRLRLLRDLVARAGNEQPAADAAAVGEAPCAWSLLEPLAAWMARLLLSWLFPPEGYFRDSYNDGSILWIAAELFWPVIAHHIAEPLEAQLPEHEGWHTGEDEIPAQIPVEHARHLVDFIATRPMHLPTREQLARWGETLPVEEEGPYSLSQWHAHLSERKQTLLAFLEGAIAREEPILCSL